MTTVEEAPEVLEPMPNGEMLPRPDEPAVMVDAAPDAAKRSSTLARRRSAEKRDIFPAYLKNRQDAEDLAKFLMSYGGHIVGYHAVRTPKYTALLAWYSFPGIVRVVKAAGAFVLDLKTQALLDDAQTKKQTDEYLKLEKVRREHVRKRLVGASAGLILFVAGAASVAILGPVWLQAASIAGLVFALGRKGQPSDKPVLSQATVSAFYAVPLKSDIVLRGLKATRIAGLTAKDARIDFVAPITRDGPGWLAVVDLPYGVTAGDVMEEREKLSSGLRRPLGCVWPEGDRSQHEGRLRLWVGDQDLSKAKMPAWPLLESGPLDLFQPQPFGTDQRGRWVRPTFMFTSGAIGSIPRMGKTYTLREIALICALDPRCRLFLFDGKGTGDLDPLAPVAYRLAVGDDEIEAFVLALRELHEDMLRRAKVIRGLPRAVCPESKVTSELANDRSRGLFPVFVGIDECQKLFEHPELGKEAEGIVTDLVKRGPALGVMVYNATQRPDARSLPPGISDNVVFRFCLKVMGYMANDMVLGTSSYQAGHRATTFSFEEKGIGLLKGEGSEPQIVRTVEIDGPAAERIVERARAFREAAGTLDGMAAGETLPDGPAWSFEEDLATVFATITVEKVWSEVVVEKLTELRPEVYGSWTTDQLARALPEGLSTRQVWGQLENGKGANRRGLVRAEVLEVLASRKLELSA